MIEKVHKYALESEDIFEELIEKDGFKLNHAIIKPGKLFPKHPTDADATIIIIDGILTLKLGEQSLEYYSKGQVVEVPKGIISELGNTSKERTEVFVIKS